MERVIQYIPEIKGCYGMRVWIPANDRELLTFIKAICLWGSHTDYRKTPEGYEVLYELPADITDNFLWRLACERFNITFVR
jgi:hypothetical protein